MIKFLTVFFILIIALPTAAQEAKQEPIVRELKESHPWSKGVSEEDKQIARELFASGNSLMKESICITAAKKYTAALKRWNHPAIRYNLAVALINLDRPIEMYRHLTAAINGGLEQLSKERFEQAKNYLALLETQLVRVRIQCDVRGAHVLMDGRHLFNAPGKFEDIIRPGPHSIKASKEGYVTNEVSRLLEGGANFDLYLQLKTLEELTEMRRRWPAWKPWALVGAGAVIALAGGGLHYLGNQQIRDYDKISAHECKSKDGCNARDFSSKLDNGALMQKLGIGAYAVGGAALITGAVFTYLNRPRPFIRAYSDIPKKTPISFNFIPTSNGHHSGFLATLSF